MMYEGAGNDQISIISYGEEKPVAAYDSYGIVDPTDDGPALEASLARGFQAIKIKIGISKVDFFIVIHISFLTQSRQERQEYLFEIFAILRLCVR